MNEEKQDIPPVGFALNVINHQADTLIKLMSELAERLIPVRPKVGLPNGCQNVSLEAEISEQGSCPVVDRIANTANKLTSVENQIRSILEDIEI